MDDLFAKNLIRASDERGMTLLEIMVSMAILGMIMVMVWASTSQNLDAKERVEKRDLAVHYARGALHRILDDISMAFLTPAPKGIPGEKRTPLTFFIGNESGDRDEIRFTTFSNLRLFGGAKESDQSKVYYKLVAGQAEEGEELRGMNLVRIQSPWLDYTSTVEGNELILAEGVKEFDIEYYDTRKAEWTREWDTEKIDWREKLPEAVRVKIVMYDPSSKEEEDTITLMSSALIPMFKSPIKL